MKTINLPVEDLSVDPANARMHSDRNLEAIKASLRRFGQQKPLVIDGNNVVRAGNGTLEAARALGWEEVAVVQTDLVNTEAAAYAIADNRAGELATWDQDMLAQTLIAFKKEAEEAGEDGLAGTGFSAADLQAMFGSGVPLPVPNPEAGGEVDLSNLDFDAPPPASDVRMVQLFLNEESFKEYVQIVARLSEALGTDNQTDTVMAVLRDADPGS
jgi:hypothetical protein